ncbi:MAG: nucleotidyltransferase domain-containing protein [Candidatus Rifleibacteriota bacterium]
MIWNEPDSFGEVVNRAMRLVESRYAEAAAAFVCGSVIRGDATAESDYDMVIVYSHVDNAWRESFIFENRKIEAFVHDPETMRWFFEREDAASGVPSLPNMVNQGLILKNMDGLADLIKEQAHKLLLRGPKPLSSEQIDNYRYFINDLCDDLKYPRNFEESIAVASRLYSLLAEFYLRVNGHWSASGKSIPRALKQISPELAYRFNEAFKLLFSSEMTYQVIALSEEILRPWGGMLYDGYHRNAPAKFRLKRPGRRKTHS